MTETEKGKKEWFPMRITYNREMKIKSRLDQEGIENFIPMQYEFEKTDDWRVKKNLVPAIRGMIFVHSTQQQLTRLKMYNPDFEPMHYTTNHLSETLQDRILRVPDRQMENFMRVASVQDNRISYLEVNDYLLKPGKRVRVTDGDFKGAEGVIKRIKKRQCVVIQIEGIAAVAITFVPAAWLEEIK